MNNGIFKLNWGDVGRGVVVAFLSGAALPILAIIQTPDFSIVNVDWGSVGVLFVNGGLAGLAGYIVKNFLSTEDGRFLGKIG